MGTERINEIGKHWYSWSIVHVLLRVRITNILSGADVKYHVTFLFTFLYLF